MWDRYGGKPRERERDGDGESDKEKKTEWDSAEIEGGCSS